MSKVVIKATESKQFGAALTLAVQALNEDSKHQNQTVEDTIWNGLLNAAKATGKVPASATIENYVLDINKKDPSFLKATPVEQWNPFEEMMGEPDAPAFQ